MKNNMFQKMLAGMFVISVLFTVCSVSADRNELPSGYVSDAEAAFNKIMNRPWQKVFRVYLKRNWGFWSINQQAQIVERMRKQGVISSSQAEEKNWPDLVKGPEVTIPAMSVTDRNELPSGYVSSAEAAFDKIMNKPWQKAFGMYVRSNWGFWSINQQAKIVKRMEEQGLISPSQAE